MKKVFGLLMALVIGAAAIAQETPHERAIVRNDIAREREKRHEVARDIFRGEPERARADHRTAVAYHREAHREIRQIHRRQVRRHHPRPIRHHYRHPRPHRRTTVIIRH